MAYWQADHLIILNWLRNTQLDDVIIETQCEITENVCRTCTAAQAEDRKT